jgi:Spx/MgsR family transcriptional regulator
MPTTVYGIPNCDTVRKARRWLDEHDIEYRFHDLRSDGIDPQELQRWLATLGWETLLNRRSSSWKALPEAAREGMDAARAAAQVLEMPTLIRRPLLDRDGELEVGFSPARYATIFGR